jgi:hypothetical protein
MEREAIHQRRMRDQTRQRVDALGAENRDGSVWVGASQFQGEGTWNIDTDADGIAVLCHSHAIAGDHFAFADITLPVRAEREKGRELFEYKCVWSVDINDSDDIRWELWMMTLPAVGAAAGPTYVVLAGDVDAHCSHQYDTAAERGDSTGLPSIHTSLVTIPVASRAYLRQDNVLRMVFWDEHVGPVNHEVHIYGADLKFNETLVDLE